MKIAGLVLRPNRPFGPNDVTGYTEEVRQAMKLLEPLLQAGYLALHPDHWQGGRLSFLPPRIAKNYGWVPPVVPEPEPGTPTCRCDCCPEGRGG